MYYTRNTILGTTAAWYLWSKPCPLPLRCLCPRFLSQQFKKYTQLSQNLKGKFGWKSRIILSSIFRLWSGNKGKRSLKASMFSNSLERFTKKYFRHIFSGLKPCVQWHCQIRSKITVLLIACVWNVSSGRESVASLSLFLRGSKAIA